MSYVYGLDSLKSKSFSMSLKNSAFLIVKLHTCVKPLCLNVSYVRIASDKFATLNNRQSDMYTTFTHGQVCRCEKSTSYHYDSILSPLEFDHLVQLGTLLPSDVAGGQVIKTTVVCFERIIFWVSALPVIVLPFIQNSNFCKEYSPKYCLMFSEFLQVNW